MSGNLRARLNRTSGRLVLGLALVVALVAATVAVDLPDPSHAGAATDAVVAEAYRGYPGYCQGTQGWPGLPVAMTVRVSNTDYAQGEIVRVTFTVGSAFPKITHDPPADPPDLLARFSGVIKIQGGWSGQEIVGWSKPEGVGSYQDGSSVVFIPGSLPQGEWYNNLFGPGQELWIDYRAPSPVGRAGLDYWGGVITGIERADWFDVLPTQERIGSCPVDGANEAPSAGFTWVQSTTNPLEVAFTNTSGDPNGDSLSYTWDFGDGTISTDVSPTHTFAENKAYTVKLTAKDPSGATATASQVVDLRGLVVNSTGDGGATDASKGCDTGGMVGDQPECTLRAAIEVLNERQKGTITFDIAGAALPTIATATTLPQITAPDAVVDGTTQPGGFVKVTGGGRSGALLDVAGKGVRLTGLVLDQIHDGVRAAGDGVVVEGNAIGALPTGTTAGAVTLGVVAPGKGVVVRDNVISAIGDVVVQGADAVVEANHLGVSRAGGVIGDDDFGVLVLGPNATVQGNTIRSTIVGVDVATGATESITGSGSRVTGNFIGVTAAGAALSGQGEGVRVDGATNVTVSGNRIDQHQTSGAGVSVAGRAQLYSVGEGDDATIGFWFYLSGDPLESPVTGGKVTVSGNVIGDVARGASASGERPRNGVIVWADAAQVTVTGNTIAGQSGAGIELHGGTGHVVQGNAVGTSGSGAGAVSGVGITADATPNLTLGRRGAGNIVVATTQGIRVGGEGASGTITGNTVTVSGTEDGTAGISVPTGTGGFTFEANTVTGFTTGIGVASPNPQVVSNVVADSGTGIDVTTDGATISTNIVTGTTIAAIVAGGANATVEKNLVGRTSSTGDDVGNLGNGIVVLKGDTKVTRNVVAGSGGSGISVAPTAKAELRGNRILGTTGSPIQAPGGPPAPTLGAVIKTTYEGAVRTALLITDLPTDAGTIEVFANASCADGEAEKVLEVTKSKTTGLTSKVVLLKDRPDDDAFTVTFTAAGSTSELSTCTPIGVYPDSDGDGSPDPFDALWGGENDPTRTVFVTDDEQLLGLSVAPKDPETGLGGGRLVGAGPVDAPPARPGNLSLPYGLIGFTIEDLDPGGTTAVYLTVLDGEGPASDDAYWKYGPQAPGEAPTWYDFSYDEETDLGGRAIEPVDVAGFGIRRPFAVVLRDGALGDDDGGMNGSIHDPGGIARVLGGGPTDPVDPTPTTEPPVVSPVTTVPVAGGGAAAADPATTDGSLPYTGSDDGRLLALGTLLLAAGAVAASVAGVTTRRRHRWTHRA